MRRLSLHYCSSYTIKAPKQKKSFLVYPTGVLNSRFKSQDQMRIHNWMSKRRCKMQPSGGRVITPWSASATRRSDSHRIRHKLRETGETLSHESRPYSAAPSSRHDKQTGEAKQHSTFQEIAAGEMEFFRALIIHGWKSGEVAPRPLCRSLRRPNARCD